ncbi:hypothetical protein AMJ44_11085 [candidate division WOR-1 bacterium DG_54_3]|uniref:Uncharacterized protein n=1 Tax=candidate division WOR-1 bacterium DG_54_3 TaxID=1703775 RepID=A0A0S7XRP4_UNCSA|nr:MAG: hypothetical protein AMJ44_11085 [candidate division WOR-1 bacterium DG_54_3]
MFRKVYVDKIKSLTGINEIKIYSKHKRNNCFYIKLAPNQTVKLFPIFYDSVSEDMYLARKYIKLKKSYEMLKGANP